MLYVAYGSNMDIEQMKYRCPNSKLLFTALLNNYRLMFKSRFATIEPEQGVNVPITIWQITKEDEVSLDRYEGFPVFYYKKIIDISEIEIINNFDNNILQDKMMVYIMKEHNPFIKPSDYYYSNMMASYKKFGFDIKILSEALEYAV